MVAKCGFQNDKPGWEGKVNKKHDFLEGRETPHLSNEALAYFSDYALRIELLRGEDRLRCDGYATEQTVARYESVRRRHVVEGAATPPRFWWTFGRQSRGRGRAEYGGSLITERNVLEWRFSAIADRYDLRVIVFCQEGCTFRWVWTSGGKKG